jgi:hypothetical protein
LTFAGPRDTGDLFARWQDEALLELLVASAPDRADSDEERDASPRTQYSTPDDPRPTQVGALDEVFATLGFLAI